MYWTTGSQVLYLQANDTDSYPFFHFVKSKKIGVRGYSILYVAVYVSGINF